jgi:hypothetical protein
MRTGVSMSDNEFAGKGILLATESTTSPNPEEGLRLVRAFLFLGIRKQTLREAIIRFVEDLADQLERQR